MGFKVTAECAAHIPVETPEGRMLTTLYKNAILPEGVPQDRIDHLLSVGAIERTDVPAPKMAEVEPTLAASGGSGDAGGKTSPPAVTEQSGNAAPGSEKPPVSPSGVKPFDDPERIAAREKLPTDGSLPDGRAAHAVWVEAAVAKGYDYKAAVSTEKPELIALLRK